MRRLGLRAGLLARCQLAGVAGLAVALLSGCAGFNPQQLRNGQTLPEVQALLGAPTGRHALAAGAQRIEFARGPYGRETWMVDLGPDGRVTATAQVLDAAHFEQVTVGMSGAELLQLLGRPGARQSEWQQRQTWSWRYVTHDCLWARVTLGPDGKVLQGVALMPDPVCDSRR